MDHLAEAVDQVAAVFPDGPGGGPGGLSLDGGDEDDGDGPGPHRRRKDRQDRHKPEKTPEKGHSRKAVWRTLRRRRMARRKDGKKKDAKKTDAMHKKVVKARKCGDEGPNQGPNEG